MEACVARTGFRVRMHDFGGHHAFAEVGSCAFAALRIIAAMTNPVIRRKESIRSFGLDRANDVGFTVRADCSLAGARKLENEGNVTVTFLAK